MSNTFTTEVDFIVRECPVCGVQYGLTQEYFDRKNDGSNFYCPNGHDLVRTRPKESILQDRIKRIENERDSFKNRMYHYKEESEHKEYQRRGYKAALTRQKNAISRGECPCCGDEFSDLKRHMEEKHPKYQEGVIDA